MNLDCFKGIADAVLYEGYLLYPYRPSSIKNRQRWTFGGVFPLAFAGREGDASVMQTQVLLNERETSSLDVCVRFLQVAMREVASFPRPLTDPREAIEANATPVARLNVDGVDFLAWDEAIEREITLPQLAVAEIESAPHKMTFRFEAARNTEPVCNSNGDIAGLLIRSTCAIAGSVEVSAERLLAQTCRIAVCIENSTPFSGPECAERTAAQRRAFLSTHTLLGVHHGAFMSLMDPPEDLREIAANCDNHGTWPVLLGRPGDTDAMLSSPIILYDHPEIAPESAGDLFDATEIDEILTLRILTMTDEEKLEMAACDPRARALLERTQRLTADELGRMHGTLRRNETSVSRSPADSAVDKPRLAVLTSHGSEVAIGSKVRLHPKAGGDIFDLALGDKIAVVAAIERDFEDRVHVAVTLCDDPGRDLGAAGFPGHRFYFSQDEIEPLGSGDGP